MLDLFLVSLVYWVMLLGLFLWLGRRTQELQRRLEELEGVLKRGGGKPGNP
jgi:hypothetical protein